MIELQHFRLVFPDPEDETTLFSFLLLRGRLGLRQ